MRHTFISLAAPAVLAAASTAALAHASLERAEAPAGAYKAVIGIPHGCDGQATHTVRIELPEGFIDARPIPKGGWALAVEKADYAKPYKLHGREIVSGAKAVTWSGGDLPDDFYDEFAIRGTLAVEPGSRLAFIVRQLCADGEIAWDQVSASGEDAHALEHPAPTVTIAQAEGGHGHHAATPASDAVAGDLTVSGGWVKAMLPGQPTGGGYLTIANGGGDADRLVGVSTPAAGRAEVHEMKVENDVMVMRPVEGGIGIPAGGAVELKPGGLHLMFMQVAEPFAEGATVPVTLEFEKAGKVELSLPVRAAAGGDDHSGHGAHGQGG